jgi:hypothetical protein
LLRFDLSDRRGVGNTKGFGARGVELRNDRADRLDKDIGYAESLAAQ